MWNDSVYELAMNIDGIDAAVLSCSFSFFVGDGGVVVILDELW
jgi:hypothetical protein